MNKRLSTACTRKNQREGKLEGNLKEETKENLKEEIKENLKEATKENL